MSATGAKSTSMPARRRARGRAGRLLLDAGGVVAAAERRLASRRAAPSGSRRDGAALLVDAEQQRPPGTGTRPPGACRVAAAISALELPAVPSEDHARRRCPARTRASRRRTGGPASALITVSPTSARAAVSPSRVRSGAPHASSRAAAPQTTRSGPLRSEH